MIFNINFFLVSFAQSNIFSYTCVYAKQYSNVTNAQYGILGMVLPTLSFFVKPALCSMADSKGLHRQFLIGCLTLMGTSYGSLAVLPFFKDPNDHDSDTLAWIVICGAMIIGSVSSACVFSLGDVLASNYARKHNLAYSRMRIYSNVGWACGAAFILIVGDVSWLPSRVLGLCMLVLCSVIDIALLTLWPYPEDFEMFHDGSTVEQRKLSIVGPNTVALMALNRPRASISRDMLERIRAGRSKSVGHLPRQPNDEKPSLQSMKQVADEPKEYSNFQTQMILLKIIATAHKSLPRYIFLFIVFGIAQGAFWNYQLDFIKSAVTHSDAEFDQVAPLCMIFQAVFGEILINIVAPDLLRMFGANANLSLAMVMLGVRCIYYAHILPKLGANPWIVLAEAMQGPSLGLYWVLVVDIGSNYALMVTDFMGDLKKRGIVRDRQQEEELNGCLRATMIGLMSGCMEGLGVALGAYLAGVVSSSLGYTAMWNMCAGLIISFGMMNLGWDVMNKLVLKRQSVKKSTTAISKHNNSDTHNNNNNNNNNFVIPTVTVESMDIKL